MTREDFDRALNQTTSAGLIMLRHTPAATHDLCLAYQRPDLAAIVAGVLDSIDLALKQLEGLDAPKEEAS